MKKRNLFVITAFVLAIASAFTTKALDNPTGYLKIAGTVYSGPTNDSRCAVDNGPTPCTIMVGSDAEGPVYDSQGDINNPDYVLTHPNP